MVEFKKRFGFLNQPQKNMDYTYTKLSPTAHNIVIGVFIVSLILFVTCTVLFVYFQTNSDYESRVYLKSAMITSAIVAGGLALFLRLSNGFVVSLFGIHTTDIEKYGNNFSVVPEAPRRTAWTN